MLSISLTTRSPVMECRLLSVSRSSLYQAIYQAPRTTTRHPEHRVCPYLLKGLAIERPNQVWSADILSVR